MTIEARPSNVVIIGGGHCAAKAALALSDGGFGGTIVMLSSESDAPYDRPPLSKSAISSLAEPQPSTLLSVAAAYERGIDLRLEERVGAIDRCAQSVSLASGASVPYDRLLIATGATARQLTIPGKELALTLRTMNDARRLARDLRAGASVVVIGAGFLGLEVAASARLRDCKVTVVEVGARALGRGVPQSLADQIVKRHRSEQVQFRFNTQVNAIEKIGDSFAVHLDDAEVLPADVIVAGVGAVPETQLAESAGLVLDNGIAVDECLFTSDPLILAAGDCCSSPSLLYGGVRIRLESWRAARDQALVAAENVLGEQRVYDAVPWFWSDQFDLTLQIAGLPGFATREVVREQPTGAAVHFGLDDSGRLVSVAALATPESFGVFKSIKLAERLIAAKAKPDPASLADPSIALRSFASV